MLGRTNIMTKAHVVPVSIFKSSRDTFLENKLRDKKHGVMNQIFFYFQYIVISGRFFLSITVRISLAQTKGKYPFLCFRTSFVFHTQGPVIFKNCLGP